MNPLGRFHKATKTGRRWPAILLAVLIALTYAAIGKSGVPGTTDNEKYDEIRLPVANPPLEPGRPDLLAEPRITDDNELPRN
jgi:hypothetical protein